MQGTFAILLVAIVVTLIEANGPPDCGDGTVDGNGMCIKQCPPGTVIYVSNCTEETMPQRTCRQPKPRSIGRICDYTHCECVNGLLWDEAKSKCVHKDQCADQKEVDGNAGDIFV